MRRTALLLALALLLPPVAAGAQERGYNDGRPGHRAQRLDRILPAIRRSHPGTFYDAEGPFEGPDGRLHYRLKWLTPDGRIVWLDTDAESGRVLGQMRAPGFEPRRDERREPRWRDRAPERGHDRGGKS